MDLLMDVYMEFCNKAAQGLLLWSFLELKYSPLSPGNSNKFSTSICFSIKQTTLEIDN